MCIYLQDRWKTKINYWKLMENHYRKTNQNQITGKQKCFFPLEKNYKVFFKFGVLYDIRITKISFTVSNYYIKWNLHILQCTLGLTIRSSPLRRLVPPSDYWWSSTAGLWCGDTCCQTASPSGSAGWWTGTGTTGQWTARSRSHIQVFFLTKSWFPQPLLLLEL